MPKPLRLLNASEQAVLDLRNVRRVNWDEVLFKDSDISIFPFYLAGFPQ